MLLRVPPDELRQMAVAVSRGGLREIGGQLFGEQLAPSDFRITKVTVQGRWGAVARFVVDLLQAASDALEFFNQTHRNYRRFNYIGEWHSHPLFAVHPSGEDIATMRSLVRSPSFKGNFAVLLIVRLDAGKLIGGAWLFDPTGTEMTVDLEMAA